VFFFSFCCCCCSWMHRKMGKGCVEVSRYYGIRPHLTLYFEKIIYWCCLFWYFNRLVLVLHCSGYKTSIVGKLAKGSRQNRSYLYCLLSVCITWDVLCIKEYIACDWGLAGFAWAIKTQNCSVSLSTRVSALKCTIFSSGNTILKAVFRYYSKLMKTIFKLPWFWIVF